MFLNYENVRLGYEWILKNYPELAQGENCTDEIFHYGVKGQKWGVRNGPPYPLDKKESVEKTPKGGIVKTPLQIISIGVEKWIRELFIMKMAGLLLRYIQQIIKILNGIHMASMENIFIIMYGIMKPGRK